MVLMFAGFMFLVSAGSAAAEAGARRYHLAAGADSKLVVHVPRAGLLRFLGHSHTIEARQFSGVLLWAEVHPKERSLVLEVPAEQLVVTDDAANEDTRTEIRTTLLGSTVLAVEAHPFIRFTSSEITTKGTAWQVSGELAIRGTTRSVVLSAEVIETNDGSLRISGMLPLQPADYGIDPVTAAGGTIRTADTIEIHFVVKGHRSEEADF